MRFTVCVRFVMIW